MAEIRRPLVRRLTALTAAAGAALLLAACGGGAASGAAPGAPATGTTGTGTAAPTARAASASASAAGAPPAAPAAGSGQPAATAPAAATAVKVSANRATRAQLQQAFEAAGIPNAARMAVEVEEYRPYPTNDPGFAKLRQELSKYNIPVAVVDQIVATLTLD
jgi:hypothetical protein